MDLNLYLRVIWRFRFLVLAGVLLALVLAFLAMVSVSFAGGSPKLKYRQHETWSTAAVVQVTQAGFPEGRTVFPSGQTTADGQVIPPATPFADPGRLVSLAQFYSALAQSDAVKRLMYRTYHVKGTMGASPMSTGQGSRAVPQPLLAISGTAHTAKEAETTADAGTRAFVRYLAKRQIEAGIPKKDRVIVEIVNAPRDASLVTGRKKTVPVVVLVTVLIATLGLAFILENLRPRVRPIEASESASSSSATMTGA